jgi:hypothetical protein
MSDLKRGVSISSGLRKNKEGFSVPAFASRASARQAVSPAAASLQTGSSTGFTFYASFC